MPLLEELRQRRSDTRAAADGILTRAAGEQRDLTADEFGEYQQRAAELREIDDRLEQLLADEIRELRAAAGTATRRLDHPTGTGTDPGAVTRRLVPGSWTSHPD